MNALKQHLKDKGITNRLFAKGLGLNEWEVSRLCNGVRIPSIELATQIDVETGGAVPVSSWVRATESVDDWGKEE